MTLYEATMAGACLTLLFWSAALRTANARGIALGSLPVALPAIAGIVAGFTTREGTVGVAGIAAVAAVIIAALVDARTGLIFDDISGALLLSSFLLAMCRGTMESQLIGTAVCASALGLLYVSTRGAGIGLGDVKLGTALGMACGARVSLTAIGVAFSLGGLYAGWLLATRRATPKTAIRFAPFIAVGTATALLLPDGVLL